MQGNTTAWQRLPGSGRRVKQNGSILRANEHRLRSESPGSAWNAEDDLLHAALLALCDERGASSTKDLTHYLQSNEQSKRDCYVQFLAKIDRTKKVLQ